MRCVIVLQVMKVLGTVKQGLGWNTPHVQAGTAKRGRAGVARVQVDTCGGRAGLRGPERGGTVAMIVCDSGLKYLSTDLWEDSNDHQ